MATPIPGGISQQGEYGYYNGTGVVDSNPEHAADEAGSGGSMTPGESAERAQSAAPTADISRQHMERAIGVAGPDEGGDMEGRLQPTEHSAPTREDTARGPVTHTGGNLYGTRQG